eukprot:5211999-Alexandrium_andersonii.AAC.1
MLPGTRTRAPVADHSVPAIPWAVCPRWARLGHPTRAWHHHNTPENGETANGGNTARRQKTSERSTVRNLLPRATLLTLPPA